MAAPFFSRKFHETAAARLEHLRASKRDLLNKQRELAVLTSGGSLGASAQAIDAAISILESKIEEPNAAFDALSAKRDVATEGCRAFRLDQDIRRDAHTPSIVSTVLVAQAAILAEGMTTAGLMIADGKMDVIAGLMYGVSIAALNVWTGLLTGWLPGRHLLYRIDARDPKPRDRKIRIAAWGGFAALTGAMGLLNFAAARVRATGSHKNIFDFEAVGLLSTAGDYYAVAIMVLGVIGGVLAIYKGWTGISDPIPGFSELQRQATTAIDDAADDLRNRLLDSTEAIYDTTMEDLEILLDELDDAAERRHAEFVEINDEIVGHNHDVEAAKEKLLRLAEEERATREAIKKKTVRAPKIDLSAFNALKLTEIAMPDAEPENRFDAKALMARLESAFNQATAAVEGAFATFMAGVSAFDLKDR